MKGLILAALVGFVLAITLALPFTEDEAMVYNNGPGRIRNDITQSNQESKGYDDELDTDDNEEDEENHFEDEEDEDEEEEEDDDDEEEEDDDDEEEEDDDDDGDDNDKYDVGERESSLSNPVQQSSDPAWPLIPLVVRGARRLARRFRRRHRRGRRVGRWFRRRRGRG